MDGHTLEAIKMIQKINSYDFRAAFDQLRPDNFTYEGLNALFEYFEEYEEDSGQQVELDVIAICCDFTEYASIAEVLKDYSNITNAEELRDHTMVIEFTGGVIVANF